MSKTKRRKKARSRAPGANVAAQERVLPFRSNQENADERAPKRQKEVGREVPARRASPRRAPRLQNAVFALMATLGFLGFAIFFIFFYSEDTNHYLYGGVMGLTALGWLFIATRRWSAYRQSVRT